MRSAKILILLALAGAMALVAIQPAEAQGAYPQARDDYVNDYAGVLSRADAEGIRAMFEDLEHKTGIEAVAVTVNSFRDYNTGDKTLESFATNLFNAWGVGHKRNNNGIMVLVAVKDRQCRIELGRGYGARYDAAMKQVIDERMLPYFRDNEYSRGIFEGCRGAIEKATKKVSALAFYKWHIVIGLLIIVCVLAGISFMRSGKKGWGWAFFAAAGALLLLLLRLLKKGKSSGGFGGGSSSGGGASGRW